MTGAELREERRAYGLSQSALAHGLGYTRETVARWEACNKLPQHVVNHIDLYLATIPPDTTNVGMHPATSGPLPTQARGEVTKYVPPAPPPRRRGGQS